MHHLVAPLAFALLALVTYAVAQWSVSLTLTLNAFLLGAQSLQTAATTFTTRMVARRDGNFTFGYTRMPALLRFAAAITLCLATASILVEGIHHLIEPHDTHPVYVELLCLVQVAVQITLATNFKADAVKLLRTPVVSLCVCFAVSYCNASRLDVLGATVFGAIVAVDAVDTMSQVVPILNCTFPLRRKTAIADCLRNASIVRGVRSIESTQCWSLDEATEVCAMKIAVSDDCDVLEVTRQVKRVLSRVFAITCVEASTAGSGGNYTQQTLTPARFPAPPVQLSFPI